MNRERKLLKIYHGITPLMLMIFLLFFNLTISMGQAQVDFIVTIGQDKIFTEYNFTDSVINFPNPYPEEIITTSFGEQEFSLSGISPPGSSSPFLYQIKQGAKVTVAPGDTDQQTGLAIISMDLEYRLSAYATSSLSLATVLIGTEVLANDKARGGMSFEPVVSSSYEGDAFPSGLVERNGSTTYKSPIINLSTGSNHTIFAFIEGGSYNIDYHQKENAYFQGWAKIKEIRINFTTPVLLIHGLNPPIIGKPDKQSEITV
jgi:hypothetical protein